LPQRDVTVPSEAKRLLTDGTGDGKCLIGRRSKGGLGWGGVRAGRFQAVRDHAQTGFAVWRVSLIKSLPPPTFPPTPSPYLKALNFIRNSFIDYYTALIRWKIKMMILTRFAAGERC